MTTKATTGPNREAVRIDGVHGLMERVGTELGVSEWVPVEQVKIDVFAKLTGDEQWIHVDPERARAGRFGTTVQHGFFTLGLATGLLDQVFTVENISMTLNYGLNRVRFPTPLRVDSQVRMHVALTEGRTIPGGVEIVFHLTFEIEGEPKPCCVADLVFRYYD